MYLKNNLVKLFNLDNLNYPIFYYYLLLFIIIYYYLLLFIKLKFIFFKGVNNKIIKNV
jgi:hypothetical protein